MRRHAYACACGNTSDMAVCMVKGSLWQKVVNFIYFKINQIEKISNDSEKPSLNGNQIFTIRAESQHADLFI